VFFSLSASTASAHATRATTAAIDLGCLESDADGADEARIDLGSRDGHRTDFSALGGPRKVLCAQSEVKVWIMKKGSTARKHNTAIVAAIAQQPEN